jgi:hypothetical protein
MRLGSGKILLAVLAWAAIVAASATFFGYQFAPEATHHVEDAMADEAEHAEAGEAEEEAEHAEAGEAEEEAEHADEGASGSQVVGAILISVGGAVLVPLTVLPARRREREESVQVETEVEAEPGVEKVLVTGMVLLSIGAAVIHFAVIAQHFDEWWLSGIFFVGVALFQLAWAVAVVLRPSRRLYLAGAVVNALIVLTWIVSRTTGIPVGPGAGEPEAVGLPDVLATACEVLLVVAALALLARGSALRHPLKARAAAIGTWVAAAAVVTLTGLALAVLS